jgi:hypothetical protein
MDAPPFTVTLSPYLTAIGGHGDASGESPGARRSLGKEQLDVVP